mmetsp:Transcript_25877/g.60906  ORF Transcript_25877/g.60906 Transcript_25877/m.60906 type:complete len:178 (-) Transcript_25877:2411-2944(-)
MHVSRTNILTVADGVDGAVFHHRNPSNARFGLHTQQRNLKGSIGYSAAAGIFATNSISGAGDDESGNQSAMWTLIMVVIFFVFLSCVGIFFYKTLMKQQREAVVRARESRAAPREPRTEHPRTRTRTQTRTRTRTRTRTPPIQPYATESPVIDRCSETCVDSDDEDEDDDSLGMGKA